MSGSEIMSPEEAAAWLFDLPDRTSPEEFPEMGLITAAELAAFASEAGQEARAEVIRLKALLNAPELVDFAGGVVREAAHQRERWGAKQDAGKEPADWFWLIGYLAQKAMMAQIAGDLDKAKHHCISTAAALANWHAALLGADLSMRPGILPPAGEQP